VNAVNAAANSFTIAPHRQVAVTAVIVAPCVLQIITAMYESLPLHVTGSHP
jgi:hypothetical protein